MHIMELCHRRAAKIKTILHLSTPLIINFAMVPVPLAVMVMVECIDIIYVLCRMFMPFRYMSDFRFTLLSRLVRFILYILELFEFCRALVFIGAVGLVVLLSTTFCLHVLTKIEWRMDTVILYYQVYRCHAAICCVTDNVFFIILCCAKVFIVCTLWYVIRAAARTNFMFYAFLLFCAVAAILIAMLSFREFIRVSEQSMLIKKGWATPFVWVCGRWRQRRLVRMYKAALVPVQYKCGAFFVVRRSTPMTFLNNLVARLIDSVFLITLEISEYLNYQFNF